MKRVLIWSLLLSLSLSFFACKKSDIAKDIPSCIYKEISQNEKNANWNVGSVYEFQFQGKLVYAFNSSMPDGASDIKDDNCNTMCSVGGWGGPGITLCNGVNFYFSSVLVRVVWQRK